MSSKKRLKTIEPKNKIQKEFLNAVTDFPVVFAIGSAGSGKTFLSAAKALEDLSYGFVDRIVLVRPVVATEDLGYLPGDFNEKLDPYLYPLYDCLSAVSNPSHITQLKQIEKIIVAPIAFMRGRTFHNSFIILDEAQNTTITQMKLFLTRFGENVRVVITGDLSQSDLPGENGLTWAINKLQNAPSVKIVQYSNKDVVRSALAAEIINYLDD